MERLDAQGPTQSARQAWGDDGHAEQHGGSDPNPASTAQVKAAGPEGDDVHEQKADRFEDEPVSTSPFAAPPADTTVVPACSEIGTKVR